MNKPCIPWHPIPEAANHYTALRVVQLAYHMHHDPLSLILIAPWRPPGEAEERDVAWRLSFQVVRGFRNKPLGWWAGASGPPRPFSPQERTNGWSGPAMWELTTSSFLDECTQPQERSRWHHYVIADFAESYEIVALSWSAEQLAGTWQDHLQYLESEHWPGSPPWLPPRASDPKRAEDGTGSQGAEAI
ncbi:MAG TPA: hypothetical protein VGS80_09040 [Ktedonobacterales bacterium]|nr:hypothetical protein [Ktedonobacterales bacterium]